MKKSRFTETQIVSILKQADAGVPVKDICRQAGISVPTYYKWKSKYGLRAAACQGPGSGERQAQADVRRAGARQRRDEGSDRKKTVGPEQKREAVRYLVEVHTRPLSRSCDCVGLSRAAWYQPPVHWTVRDAEIIAALAEVVENRPSRGFWKC